MYVTTFYSFKGGVGRTMALTNIAYELARAGKKVLVVDFDLEAPGLDTIEASAKSSLIPGIVDYVTDFSSTGIAPDVREYIYPAPDWPKGSGELWVMPAGRPDSHYAHRLAIIDWGNLYAENDGFLLFEDLRAQWTDVLGMDYVLIDSRTGHSDVAGICTRQLPDAVVILFIPNEQNFRGLVRIVQDIRDEAAPPRRKKILLHFVMSNVPELDDEEDILGARVRTFRKGLSIGRDLDIVHRYDSLALLNQAVFTRDRPRSRLTREYRAVTNKIRSRNTEDSFGALRFLKSFLRGPIPMAPTELESQFENIRVTHQANGDVLVALAKVRIQQGRAAEAVGLLEDAIKSGHITAELFISLAEAKRLIGQPEGALEHAAHVFELDDADFFPIQRSVELIRALDSSGELILRVANRALISRLEPEQLYWLAQDLNQSHEELLVAREIFRRLEANDSETPPERSVYRSAYELCLIGLQEFEEAKRSIISVAPTDDQGDVSRAFNYAMASWGALGKPESQLFEVVVKLDDPRSYGTTPNYHQCLAMAFWAIGQQKTARERLALSAERIHLQATPEFSCWRYLRMPAHEFNVDLERMREMFQGVHIAPEVFTRSSAVNLHLLQASERHPGVRRQL